MLSSKSLSRLVFVFALVSTACAAGMPAPAPSFTLSAGNVTMASNGVATVPLTLTSVNGFVGSVAVNCNPPTVAAGVRAPFCQGGGPVIAYPLTANGTATGGVNIIAVLPNVEPAVRASQANPRQQGSWTLAGILLLGMGMRRRSRQLARTVLALVGMGVITLGMSGCGGPPTLTPGAYVFTFNATSVDITPALTASATATVTVPAGIVTKSNN